MNIYDIDGVLAEENPQTEWLKLKSVNWYILTRKMRYKPKDKKFAVLTSRPRNYKYSTMIWFFIHGIMPWRYKLHMLNINIHDGLNKHDRAKYKYSVLSTLYNSIKNTFFENEYRIREYCNNLNLIIKDENEVFKIKHLT